MPAAKETAKKTPVATSPPSVVRRRTYWMPRAIATVKGSATHIARSTVAPSRRPRARPPKVAWARPSERSPRPRWTMKTPSSAPAAPSVRPAYRARRTKPWPSGERRAFRISSITRPRTAGGRRVVVVAAEGGAVPLAVQHLRRRAPRLHAGVEVDDAVRQPPHRGRVVGHEHRGEVLAGRDPRQEVEELPAPAGVHPGRRLVEQEEGGVVHERAREVGPLHLSPGEPAQHRVERAVRRRPARGPRGPARGRPRPRGPATPRAGSPRSRPRPARGRSG